jgi:CRP/FNR family transcriptional regulator, dissimilatory nitrate respiration regulator
VGLGLFLHEIFESAPVEVARHRDVAPGGDPRAGEESGLRFGGRLLEATLRVGAETHQQPAVDLHDLAAEAGQRAETPVARRLGQRQKGDLAGSVSVVVNPPEFAVVDEAERKVWRGGNVANEQRDRRNEKDEGAYGFHARSISFRDAATYDRGHMDWRNLVLPDELRTLVPAGLHEVCEAVDCRRGTTVFAAGSRPQAMYYVAQGEVILRRLGEDGESVVLQRTRRGFVGEASLFSDRYHCDAVAAADSALRRLPIGPLTAALQKDPAFALRWIAMLSRETRRLRSQCERLSLKTVEARLIHLILAEGDASGLSVASGLKSVAEEIGVTHEALYRAITKLERRGQLVRAPGRLQLAPSIAG